jgi:hypothetical protein
MRGIAMTALIAGSIYVALAFILAVAAFREDDPVAFAPVVLLAQPVASATSDAMGPIAAIMLGVAVNAGVFGLLAAGVTRAVGAVRKAFRRHG